MRAPSLDDEHVFRESPLRFLGYANEVGEAFRSHIPRVAVRASYVISFGYGFVDAAWRSNFARSRVTHLPPNQRRFVAADVFVETLAWQSLASVIFPGFTINRIVWASTKLVNKSTGRSHAAWKSWLPTVIGLASIPIIFKPIDNFTTILMTRYIRPATVAWLE